ncbi:MAG: hypothetical protein ACP5P3_00425 [Ignavibacteria bacterium]
MERVISVLSDDKELVLYIQMIAKTLLKLNKKVIIENRLKENADLIILDFDEKKYQKLLTEIRSSEVYSQKKVLGLYSNPDRKLKPLFKKGCDAIMKKDEFKASLNNLLMF